MTAASLKEKPVRDLARLARQHGVTGWHAMRKDQLIKALLRKARARQAEPAPTLLASGGLRVGSGTATRVAAARCGPGAVAKSGSVGRAGRMPEPGSSSGPRSAGDSKRSGDSRSGEAVRVAAEPAVARRSPSDGRKASKGSNGTPAAAAPIDSDDVARQPRDPELLRRLEEAKQRLSRLKSLATPPERGKPAKRMRDRAVLMVRGPHWLHAFWEITPQSIVRAQAALGQDWHGAKPVLRVLKIERGGQATPSERIIREIEIHGGVKNWFIDVREPPLACRVELGYRATSGRFHSLTRSNAVASPPASQPDTLDTHWGDIADDCEKIYAMSGGFSSDTGGTELQELFEERLQKAIGPPSSQRSDSTPEETALARASECDLELDAEMVIYGATRPEAYVTIQGEPVRLQPDGTFRVRFDLPNRRQVIPVVSSSADGVVRRTVVIAVERNTKVMDLCTPETDE
jgi:hypothetical protein